jgi:cellulose synthase/poly-beta-1,6-N-acetylglucosamine synthase-like glycosyltransferase
MDRLLSADASTDAIVVVDADSIANGEFLTALVQPFEAGARAVQGESLLYGADTTKTRLRVIAFLLINRVRPTGRSVLGLSATHLAGNGMLLDSRLLAAKPWDAFTSAEDVEYGLNLRASGVKIAFARGAVVWSPTAPTDEAADRQQLRWEGGKAHLARAYVPRLVAQSIRERKPSLLSVAFELAMPPLGFLAAIVLAGGLGSAWLAVAGELSAVVVSPWLLAIISLVLFVFIGMKAAGVSREGYRALLSVPIFILGKLLRARRILSFRGDTWVRTDRAAGTELRRES